MHHKLCKQLLLLLQTSMYTSLRSCCTADLLQGAVTYFWPFSKLPLNLNAYQPSEVCSILPLCCRWTLLCQLTNWFNAYCLVRTYSNSFEALCTVMGVFYWLASSTSRFSQPVELPHSSHPVQSRAEPSSSNDHVIQPVHPPPSSKQGAWSGLQPKRSPSCRQQRQPQLTQPCSPVNKPACLVHTSTTQLLMTNRQKALWAAAVGVLFRPSSLLFWVPLGETKLICSKVLLYHIAISFVPMCSQGV